MRERFHRCFATAATFRHGVVICALLCMALIAATETRAAIYYVDCDTGNDANDGLSETRAWRSTDKVSGFNFRNGDNVRFKKGCTWESALLKVSRSLTIEAYGDAAQRRVLPNNFILTLAECERELPAPQGLRLR